MKIHLVGVASVLWCAPDLGAQAFRLGTVAQDCDRSTAVALGDVDGDGAVDAVVATGGYFFPKVEANRLYLNDGYGAFVHAPAGYLPADSDRSLAVALGDIDGDGDLDIVFGNLGQDRLLLGDGKGRFVDATRTRLPASNDTTVGVAFGDLDGDGDLDLVTAQGDTIPPRAGAQNRLYLNDGSGKFTDATARLPRLADKSTAVLLCDIDRDGDLDILLANYEEQNRLLLNDGAGRFTEVTTTHLPADTDPTRAVAAADIDGDGKIDLVFVAFGGPNRLYIGDGRGRFTASAGLPAEASDRSTSVVLADLNLDGDTDVVVGNVSYNLGRGGLQKFYVNTGAGVFGSYRLLQVNTQYYCWSLAIGDVDCDGDPDVFTVAEFDGGDAPVCGPARVSINRHRSISMTPVRLGSNVGFGCEVTPLYGPADTLVSPFLALTQLAPRVPVPSLGQLGIDPVVMLPLSQILIRKPGGSGGVSFFLPVLASLRGKDVFAQALFVSGGKAALSEVLVRRIQ